MTTATFQTTGILSFLRAGFRKHIDVTPSDIIYMLAEGEKPGPLGFSKTERKGQKLTVQLKGRHPLKVNHEEVTLMVHQTNRQRDASAPSAPGTALYFDALLSKVESFNDKKDGGFLPVVPARDRRSPPQLAMLNLDRLDYFDLKTGNVIMTGLDKPFKLMRGHPLNELKAAESFCVVRTPTGRTLYVNEGLVKSVKTMDGAMGFFRRLFVPTRWGKGSKFSMITFKDKRKLCVRNDRSDMPHSPCRGTVKNGWFARNCRSYHLANAV